MNYVSIHYKFLRQISTSNLSHFKSFIIAVAIVVSPTLSQHDSLSCTSRVMKSK